MELPVFTLANYTTLLAAIAQGAKSIKFADKEEVFMSLDDMLRLRSLMAAELNPSSIPSRIRHTRYNSGHHL